MDTLFRLVSNTLHPHHHHQSSADQSFNSSTTQTSSSTSRSSLHHHHHPPPPTTGNYLYEEECFNFFMDNNSSNNTNNDQEDFSSSSSKHHHHHHQPYGYAALNNNPTIASSITYSHYPSTATTTPTTEFSFSPPPPPPRDLTPQPDFFSSFSGERWASDILLETGRAIADKDSSRVHHFMWMLNELSSPYGDTDQKLASYFLQALFSRMTDSGDRSYRALISATEKSTSFESTRKMLLKFQEVSPWTTFGHVASNGAIIEALDGEPKLHIVDISNTYCTQWPTLLEALATRTDDTPHLRLTILMPGSSGPGPVQKLMREIGNRMEKFARLMGVPFKFNIIHHAGDLSDIPNLSELLDVKDDEALAINCVNALHTIRVPCREMVTASFRRLNPRIITVVEEEADLDVGPEGFEFLKGYQECLRWFRVYFEALDESFSRTSNERLMLERAAGRAIMDLLAGPVNESVERRETAARWSMRLHGGGFSPVCFSDEVSDDVRALLRRYKEGWSMSNSSQGGGDHMNAAGAGIFLTWKDQPVVWASAWKPA